jgi:predicted Fe-S protein YdhL (DUF1289 family)
MLRGEPRDGPWSRLDSILAAAHTLSKDLLCSGCGQPRHEAWNPDSEGYYELREEYCQGCAELERDEKLHKDAESRRDRHVWITERPDHPHGKLRPYAPGSKTVT